MSNFSVKQWRSRMKYSRKDAAEKLEISHHTIKSYELLQRELPAPIEQLMKKLEREKNGPLGSIPGSAIKILGGGTLINISKDIALSAVSYGNTSKTVLSLCQAHNKNAELQLTRFADPSSSIQNLSDIEAVSRSYISDLSVKMVFWNPAFIEYPDYSLYLTDEEGNPVLSTSLPSTYKLARSIKEKRPDIYLVVFLNSNELTFEQQKEQANKLLNRTGADLVFCKDGVTNFNFVMGSERNIYHESFDKEVSLAGLVEIALHRTQTEPMKSLLISQNISLEIPQFIEKLIDCLDCSNEENYDLKGFAFKYQDYWISNGNNVVCNENLSVIKNNGICSVMGNKPHYIGLVSAYANNWNWILLIDKKEIHNSKIDARLVDRNREVFIDFLNSLSYEEKDIIRFIMDNGDECVIGKNPITEENYKDVMKKIKNIIIKK